MTSVRGGSLPQVPPGGRAAARVGVVTVAYNDPAVLGRSLDALAAGSYRDYRIWIVDNSTTEAVGSAFAERAGVRYVRTRDNLGFCEANNIGIAEALEAGCSHVLLLNHDTVAEPDLLEKMMAAADRLGETWLVTPKIRLLEEGGRLWYGGGYFSRIIGAGKNLGFNEADDGRFDRAGEVSYTTGCCMLVPAEAFRKAGLLNPAMFMYLDDIEFCLRAARQGFRIHYEPSASLKHELGSGANLRLRPDYYLYFSIRNKPLVSREFPYRLYLHVLAFLFAGVKATQFALVPGIPDRGRKVKAILWGAWDSVSSEPRYRKRFPRLFRIAG